MRFICKGGSSSGVGFQGIACLAWIWSGYVDGHIISRIESDILCPQNDSAQHENIKRVEVHVDDEELALDEGRGGGTEHGVQLFVRQSVEVRRGGVVARVPFAAAR